MRYCKVYNFEYIQQQNKMMMSTSPRFEQNDRSTLTVSSELTIRQKNISKSNNESKSVTSLRVDPQKEIALLKQKAHQSFMQVIQMQQLHQEQVQQLRRQFQHKEQTYKTQIDSLELKIRQLEYQNMVLEKNYRHHSYNIGESELSIDNIEVISCKQDSKLDESAIWNFMEILDNESYQEQINSVRKEIKAQLLSIETENREQKNKVQIMIDKWFEYVVFLKKQFVTLQEVHTHLKRKFEDIESFTTSSKHFFQSLQNENKFLGQQVNRLGSDKIKAEKNIIQLQRKIKQLQNKHKKPENLIAKKFQKPEFHVRSKHQANDLSIDIEEFIQQNLVKSTKQNSYKSGLLEKKTKN